MFSLCSTPEGHNLTRCLHDNSKVYFLTDTDSLSQGSSVGSLGLEDDEDRNSLKNPFDSLCCSLSDGMNALIISNVLMLSPDL